MVLKMLLHPLFVPKRAEGTLTWTSLSCLSSGPLRSSHNFLQVHRNLLTGRVWQLRVVNRWSLILCRGRGSQGAGLRLPAILPTLFTAATAKMAANNFVALRARLDTRFSCTFWTVTGMHAALCTPQAQL